VTISHYTVMRAITFSATASARASTPTSPPCLHCSRYGARIEPQFAAKSLVNSLVDIYRSEGVAGLWKGSIPSIVKVRV
jgi:hypothetical protein